MIIIIYTSREGGGGVLDIGILCISSRVVTRLQEPHWICQWNCVHRSPTMYHVANYSLRLYVNYILRFKMIET